MNRAAKLQHDVAEKLWPKKKECYLIKTLTNQLKSETLINKSTKKSRFIICMYQEKCVPLQMLSNQSINERIGGKEMPRQNWFELMDFNDWGSFLADGS